MEEQYNILAERQRYFYNKITENFAEFDSKPQDEISRQMFYKDNFGLTKEEFEEMNRVKKSVDIMLKEMKTNGIYPTANELINGFEVI